MIGDRLATGLLNRGERAGLDQRLALDGNGGGEVHQPPGQDGAWLDDLCDRRSVGLETWLLAVAFAVSG